MASHGDLDGVEIEDGKLYIARIPPVVPDAARDLALRLSRHHPTGRGVNTHKSSRSPINAAAIDKQRVLYATMADNIPIERHINPGERAMVISIADADTEIGPAHSAVVPSGRAGWVVRLSERMLALVALPGDRDEDLRKKRLMLFTTLLKVAVCPFWYGAYVAVGAAPAAFGPLVFQILTLGSVGLFLRTSNFAAFRLRQQILILFAPIWIHVALGGFLTSSGVILWAFLAPLIAILFHGARQSLVWFAALLAAIAGLALFDPLLAPLARPIAPWAQRAFFVMNFCVVTAIVYAAIRYYAALLDAEKAEQVRLNQRLLVYLRSVAAVTSAATKVEAGTFDPASLDEVGRRPDALGNLARLFKSMGVEVAARERRLREQVHRLTIKIDERGKAAQVAEITESEYFRGLQERVKGLASRRAERIRG
jgi:hypothetical protein